LTKLLTDGLNWRLRYPDVLVSPAVVEQISIPLSHHALHEHDVGNLAYFFPIFLGREYGGITSPEQFPGIVPIEDRNPGTVYKFVVGAVIDENDSIWRDDGRGTRLGNPRVELTGTHGQCGNLRGIRPVQQIG